VKKTFCWTVSKFDQAFNAFVFKEGLKVGLQYAGDGLFAARKTEGLLVTRKRLISAFLYLSLVFTPYKSSAAFRFTCFCWL